MPMPVADTLLRLAEEPEFYSIRWSQEILAEVERNLVASFLIDPAKAARRINVMKESFPEAMVDGYRDIANIMTNDAKDRHVLAAAVRCGPTQSLATTRNTSLSRYYSRTESSV